MIFDKKLIEVTRNYIGNRQESINAGGRCEQMIIVDFYVDDTQLYLFFETSPVS